MDYDSLPVILATKDVHKILGWRKDLINNLFRSKKFPSERVGIKHIIPRPRFMAWFSKTSS
jgi:hypothetical protein